MCHQFLENWRTATLGDIFPLEGIQCVVIVCVVCHSEVVLVDWLFCMQWFLQSQLIKTQNSHVH